MADFTGFTFVINGEEYYSADLGITRVSDGDRYNENLQPEIEDLTADVVGRDGKYYFNSRYSQKEIEIKIAYDNLTEDQFRLLRRVFGHKDIGELYFDERPYKKYLVKLASPIQLSYICFEEKDYTWEKVIVDYEPITEEPIYAKGVTGEDYEQKVYNGKTRSIYKGEGTITFITYYPFAKSRFKCLNSEQQDSDWAVSSGILSEEIYDDIAHDGAHAYDSYISESGIIYIYNAGDIETGVRIYCPFYNHTRSEEYIDEYSPDYRYENMTITYYPLLISSEDELRAINIQNVERQEKDAGFLIDTNTGLIYGVQYYRLTQQGEEQIITSGTLYNRFMKAGTFFKLIPNEFVSDESKITIIGAPAADKEIRIFYDYLYI